MEGTLSPADLQTVGNVQKTLGQFQDAQKLGAPVGSSTVQNLISQNVLASTKAEPGGLGLANTGFAKQAATVYKWATQANEPEVQMRLAQALLDPQDAAALMLRMKPGTQGSEFQRQLERAVNLGSGALTDSTEKIPCSYRCVDWSLSDG